MRISVRKFVSAASVLLLTSSVLLAGCGEGKTSAEGSTNKGGLEVSELRYQGSVGRFHSRNWQKILAILRRLSSNTLGIRSAVLRIYNPSLPETPTLAEHSMAPSSSCWRQKRRLNQSFRITGSMTTHGRVFMCLMEVQLRQLRI